MRKRLTVTLDDALIRRAKRHARRSGLSVSALFEALFLQVRASTRVQPITLTPVVRRLAGSLAGTTLSRASYRKYLKNKHR